MRKSIRTKFVALCLLLILFALELIGAYFVRTLTSSLIRTDTETAVHQAQWLATIVAPDLAAHQDSPRDFSSLFPALGQFVNGSVFLLNRDGVVEYASDETALIGQKRMDTVATQAFVSKQRASAMRMDPLSHQPLLEVAVPIFHGRDFEGVVETIVPIQHTYDTIHQVTTLFYTGSGLALVLTAVLGTILSRTITEPIRAVTRQARHMAGGDFSQRVAVNADDEFGDLARAINDLTDKLEDAIAANTRERERLQAIIRYMGDGVIAFDAQMRPLFCNDAAVRLLPGGSGAMGRSAELLGLTANSHSAEGGLDHGRSDARERVFLRQLGDTILHVHVTEMRPTRGIGGYVAVLRDVTEQEKLNQSRRDFVANVSHELRTPLTTIKSYIDAVREEGLDESTRARFLDVIAHEVDRMVRLTHDLLELSGLETRSRTIHRAPIELSAWLAQCVERFRMHAESIGVDLELKTDGSVVVEGDRDLLDRVIDNLLGNALKYTTSGGRVAVRLCTEDGSACIEVSDTGIGIPAEDLPHVFERFYRVDKARSRRMGGSGLGLALAREITEWHGGTIRIESEVGQGTTVIVTLPATAKGETGICESRL